MVNVLSWYMVYYVLQSAFTLRSLDKKEVEEKEEEEGKKQIKPEEVMEQNNKSKYS